MTDTGSIQLSAREMEVLALSWQCMESEPKIDVVKLAGMTGYTEGSARVALNAIKRKLRSITSSENAHPAPGKNAGTPKTPRKRATKNEADGRTPTKKRRTPAKKTTPVPAHQDDDEEFKFPKVKEEVFDTLDHDGDDTFYDQAAAYAYAAGGEESEDGI